MTSGLTPAGNAVMNAAASLALLLLAIWNASALASSGVSASCDADQSNQQHVGAPTPVLSIDIIEHGNSSGSGDDPMARVSNRAEDQALGENDILKRVHEPANQPLQSNAISVQVDLIQIDAHDVVPLASIEKTPKAEHPESSDRVESVTTHNPVVSGIETRLPGVSDANDVRFRRQMYRTDI